MWHYQITQNQYILNFMSILFHLLLHAILNIFLKEALLLIGWGWHLVSTLLAIGCWGGGMVVVLPSITSARGGGDFGFTARVLGRGHLQCCVPIRVATTCTNTIIPGAYKEMERNRQFMWMNSFRVYQRKDDNLPKVIKWYFYNLVLPYLRTSWASSAVVLFQAGQVLVPG